MLKFGILFLFILGNYYVYTQKPSPCPEIFSYEPQGTERDRWYGNVNVVSNENLSGIWLRIILDKPAELLGNWFGETTSDQNTDYLIKKPEHRVQQGQTLSIRLFVKFNTASSIPSLASIRLNGRIICNETFQAQLTTPKLHLSQPKPTTTTMRATPPRRPAHPQNELVENSGTVYNALDTGTSDFFPGDITLIQGVQPKPPTVRPYHTPKTGVSCGTIAMRATPLISHGQATTEGQWPWHVALYFTENVVKSQYTCGGTLISEDYVITAAHCVAKPQTKRPINAKQLFVHLGKHSLSSFTNVQVIEVAKIFIHENYVPAKFQQDIAILKLKIPAEFTNFIRPCCLWDESIAVERLYNKLGTVVGWGFDEHRNLSDRLLQTQMPIVPTSKCVISNRNFFSEFITETNFCAGFKNGSAACNGDSGGGMVFLKPGTGGATAVWQLRGIVSVGVALQGQFCDTNQYIIFTDAAKYLDWIRTVMSSGDDKK